MSRLSDDYTPSTGSGTYEPVNPAASGITRDGSGRVTAFTDGNGNAYAAITRDATTSLVTSFTVNGVTHTVTRDGSNRVTGVS